MRTVWKLQLNITDEPQIFRIPFSHIAGCSHVDAQGDSVCVWLEVDTEADEYEYAFYVHGTGHPIPDDDRRYVGTAITHGGNLVWHVYVADVAILRDPA